MSSTIDAFATNASAPSKSGGSNGNPQGAPQIVHFDATQRRKQKKRQAALNGHKDPGGAATAPPEQVVGDEEMRSGGDEETAASPHPPIPSAPHREPTPSGDSATSMTGRELERFLIDFVVEQTGYPPEMVELDADLEADLGIDSIKKAQLFGELGEHFEVQVSEDLSLDDFPTLRDVVSFLEGVPRKTPV